MEAGRESELFHYLSECHELTEQSPPKQTLDHCNKKKGNDCMIRVYYMNGLLKKELVEFS